VVEVLIAHGAAVDNRNVERNTPLMLAAFAGKEDVLKLLIRAKADINAVDASGDTALTAATFKSFKGEVDILLNAGADPNVRNKIGKTPLDYARQIDNIALIQMLQAHGAK